MQNGNTGQVVRYIRIDEAKLRADDFIDPGLQYDGVGRLTRYVTRLKTNYGYRLTIRYIAAAENGHRRQFERRTSAIALLAEQKSPPEKSAGCTCKTAITPI